MIGVLTGVLLAATSKKTSGSSATFIVFLVLIALVGYFLLIRPQKQKQRRQREQQSNVGVGDEVLTVGGIVGKVIAVDADRVTILSGGDTVGFPAVGSEPTRLVLVRNAIARKIEPVVAEPPSADGEHEHGPGTFGSGYENDDEGDSTTGDGRAAEGGGKGP